LDTFFQTNLLNGTEETNKYKPDVLPAEQPTASKHNKSKEHKTGLI